MAAKLSSILSSLGIARQATHLVYVAKIFLALHPARYAHHITTAVHLRVKFGRPPLTPSSLYPHLLA